MSKYFSISIIFALALSLMVQNVYAIENTFEISANVLEESSTSTPVTPPLVDVGSMTRTGSKIFSIENLNVESTRNSGIVSFTTTHLAQVKVYYGLTENYELGSISGLFYELDHSIKIPNLNPNTNYYFKIEVIDKNELLISTNSSFQTQKDYGILPLSNVTHFLASPRENSIALSWNTPTNRNIDSVRIIKSDKFFPRDINDGEIVYEGSSESYIDTAVVKDKMYYYAIFSKDSKGAYSSGVLAQAEIPSNTQIVVSPTSTNPFINIPFVENVDPIIKGLKFSDFDFVQDDRKIENTDSIVSIDGSKNLTILLDYNKVPEILKTIAITLNDPDDPSKIFTFLLRVNKEKTLYEATVAPLGRSGKYKMNIVILDYKNQGLKKIDGLLNVLVWSNTQEIFKTCGIFDDSQSCGSISYRNKIISLIIILILILIAIIGYIYKRRNKKEEEKEIDLQSQRNKIDGIR